MTATTAPPFTTRTVECTACKGTGQHRFHTGSKYVFLDSPCEVCSGAKTVTECVECGTNITPDLFHRVSPYRVYVRKDDGQEYAVRNLGHVKAHEIVAGNPGSMTMQVDAY